MKILPRNVPGLRFATKTSCHSEQFKSQRRLAFGDERGLDRHTPRAPSFCRPLANGRETSALNRPVHQERTGVPGDRSLSLGWGTGSQTLLSSGVPKERSLRFGVEFGVLSRRICTYPFAILYTKARDRTLA